MQRTDGGGPEQRLPHQEGAPEAPEPLSLEEVIAAHAWERHASDFRLLDPPVNTEGELADFIGEIMQAVQPKELGPGRYAYLHEPTGTVVIVEPRESGTALIPPDPQGYYDRLR
jgi:hypothetical protein